MDMQLTTKTQEALSTAMQMALVNGNPEVVPAHILLPDFEAMVAASGATPQEGARALEEWRQRSDARLRRGARRLEAGMIGHAALFEPVEARRLPEEGSAPGFGGDPHEVEAAMLLDPAGRLGKDGIYHLPQA